MTLGKKKCKMLREIRRRIADENDIPYVTEDCKYKGECKGTCPKCESELRYLEEQLEKRRSIGRKVTVSALAIGLAAGLSGCGTTPSGYLEGDVPYSQETELDGEIAEETTEETSFELSGAVEAPPDTTGPENFVELEGDVAYDPASETAQNNG